MNPRAIAAGGISRYGPAMRFEQIFAGLILVSAAAAGAQALRPEPPPIIGNAGGVTVSTTALPLNADDPALSQIGALKFLGAVHIRSTDPRFGGISGLRAGKPTADGLQLLSVTDTGNWFAFTTIEAGGRLTGVANAVIAPLLQPDGKPPAAKSDVDAEALEWDPETGTAMVAYEQQHRFAWFNTVTPASLDQPPARTDHLTEMVAWGANNGAEATALLPDGSRIAFAESARHPDGSLVALLTRGGTTRTIAVTGVEGFSPTDAVALDATTLLVLHRRFSPLAGVGAAITRVDLAPALAAAPASTPLPATLIARWQPPFTVDNMEGLALTRIGTRRFLYVISDDNLNSLQRTVLMKFELPEAP
jgi:hypothetical protein